MQSETNYTGVDVSKTFFDLAVPNPSGYSYHKLDNDDAGFAKAASLLSPGSWVVMEASGPYYLRLACHLYTSGFRVSVVNPLVIRRFCQMRLSRAKTDKKDSMMIAEYGRTEMPASWEPPKTHAVSLQQLDSLYSGLKKEHTALSNKLESFRNSGMLAGEVETIIVGELFKKDKLILDITSRMEHIAKKHYGEMMDNLQTIPGMGGKTAMMLIVHSGGFERFDSYRNLSSYIGICPRIFESGTSVRGRSRICKMGMSRVRALLYICSWSAKRCNRACRELYDRLLAKGKPKKQALIAVANKLLKQAFAIATKQTRYNENYVDNICF